MKSPFRSKAKITQKFGERPEYYKKFGFNGHEGIDLIPSGSDWTVRSLADGVVVRDVDVPRGGYGKYIVVWHTKIKKATWYCHLAENYLKVGDRVKKGQKIGKMGSTGNSTGPHLHLGLVETDDNGYRINLNNGYKGFVNPLSWLEQGEETPYSDQVIQNSDNWIALLQRYNFTNNKDIVFTEIDKIPTLEDANREKDKLLQEKDKQLAEVQEKAKKLSNDIEVLQQDFKALRDNYRASQTYLEEQELKLEKLKRENEELKKVQPIENLSGWQLIKKGILKWLK